MKMTILGSETRMSKKGNEYTRITVRTEDGVIGKLFSPVSLQHAVDKTVDLDIAYAADQQGNLGIRLNNPPIKTK